jgi:hypothetical protein
MLDRNMRWLCQIVASADVMAVTKWSIRGEQTAQAASRFKD